MEMCPGSEDVSLKISACARTNHFISDIGGGLTLLPLFPPASLCPARSTVSHWTGNGNGKGSWKFERLYERVLRDGERNDLRDSGVDG
ncbi:hypothetical protein GWI33_013487 [Rhynchophorus ferrugineus]|uniref:Uncharacterized protein n=1 Tax=Rhynchophorus ferrugineus TaxID=354439 RepID=A0A834MD75_RHYFE|nr:hypothetical protein GWI33_013487 [Rhynchophorus ferrugineus]